MAMGKFCDIELIECEYATIVGSCRDDIRSDFGLCEMRGDDMPPLCLDTDTRRRAAADILRGKSMVEE